MDLETTSEDVGDSNSSTTEVMDMDLEDQEDTEPKITQAYSLSTMGNDTDDNVTKLLMYSKSISLALAAQPPREKRKLKNECFNIKCNSGSDNLVIASSSAAFYFHLNPEFKKVYKICTQCSLEAEEFFQKSTHAALNGECILSFGTKPQGMEGDVIDVTDRELEDDDPYEIETMQKLDEEVIKLDENLDLDSVIDSMLKKVELGNQFQKCEETVLSEADILGREYLEIDKELALVESQMSEAKMMYDKITGPTRAVPIILEEVLIDSKGSVKKTRGDNSHIKKLSNCVQKTVKTIIQRKTNKGEMLPETTPLLEANHRVRDPDGEIMEVETQADIKNVLLPTPKVIPRVEPKKGSVVYAMQKSLLHFWVKGEIMDVIRMGPGKSPEFVIKFESTRRLKLKNEATQKQVTAKQIAYNVPCPFMLPVGARIIAKFKDELKTEPIGNGQYYAGIIAEPPKNTNSFRYLVFFDDGYAQYVDSKEVLMVYESSKEVWSDVHPDSSEFIRNYVQKYPERPMVRLSVGQMLTTEWNGNWWVARVMEVDGSLAKLKFENDERIEWMYRGSTRLSPLFEKQSRQKTKLTARRHVSTVTRAKNQPTIEYDYGEEEGRNKVKMTAKKSTGAIQATHDKPDKLQDLQKRSYDYGEFEGQIIKKLIPSSRPKPKSFIPHKCNPSCAESFDPTDKDLRKMNPLSVVLHMGWSREQAKNPRKHIFYRSPCGRRLRDLEDIYQFLNEAQCEISIDYFCFDSAVDCLNEFRHSRQHSFLPDLTYGKELTPVQVVNAFDFEYPPYVEYSADRIPGKGVKLNTNDEFLECCDCTDDCRDKSKCACWQLTLKGISFTKLSSPEYQLTGYEYKRLKDHIVSGVYECNSRCRCRKTCFNKVVQSGLKVPLQVFKTAAKGWGIRPIYDIPEGTFICIYAGQVLTEQGANEDGIQFGDEYLAELDYIECNEQIKADYESDVTDIEAEENENESSSKRKAGNVSVNGTSSRKKNGKGSTGNSKKSSDEDDSDGIHTRSRFNPSGSVENKRSKKIERLPLRQYFGEDEQCYIMDAKTVGNIGRYLNHSCQPNVFVQNVFVDTHDLRFPWVAFFSSKHIRAGSELTWDYNYDIGSVADKVMYCFCASPECRGRLL